MPVGEFENDPSVATAAAAGLYEISIGACGESSDQR